MQISFFSINLKFQAKKIGFKIEFRCDADCYLDSDSNCLNWGLGPIRIGIPASICLCPVSCPGRICFSCVCACVSSSLSFASSLCACATKSWKNSWSIFKYSISKWNRGDKINYILTHKNELLSNQVEL